MHPSLPTLLLAALLSVLTACSGEKTAPVETFQSSDVTGSKLNGAFTLTDHTGTRRSLSDFQGKVTVVFFGYTHCPDICPTTLSELAATMNRLGEKAKQVQVLFISVDPARDTPDLLAQYVPAFHPSFIGLTGSPEDIAKVAKQYQAFYKRHDAGQGKPYTMDHSAGSYVFDRQGHIRLNVPYGSGAAIFAHDIAALLK